MGLLIAMPTALQASEFDWIARNVERESGCKRTHIPFFGLARFVVAVGHPGGASELNLAVFESADIAPERFREIVDHSVGGSWKPMVRVSKRNGESTTIFAQADGRHIRMLIGTLEHGEATLVQARVNVGEFIRFVNDVQRRKAERE
jgi:hypothetical protein